MVRSVFLGIYFPKRKNPMPNQPFELTPLRYALRRSSRAR